MKDRLYHIFKVYDYKGGELSTSLNLTKDRLVGNIIEDFIDYDEIEFDKENPDVLKLQQDILGNIKELSIYAGGDSPVADFFYTEQNSTELREVGLEKLVKDHSIDILKRYCEIEEYELTKDDIELLNNIDNINNSKGNVINNSRNIPLV